MKAILTLIFVLFFGAAALAQDIKTDVQVNTIEMGAVLANADFNEVETTNENSTARLYKFKNAKVLKELSFTTKRNKAKLA